MNKSNPIHGGNLSWAALEAGCPISSIVDFSASINALGIPKSVIASIQNNLSQLKNYPDPNYGKLKKSLANFHDVSPEWILPGNGSAELLTWAAKEIVETTSGVYLVTPAFSDYKRALSAFGAEIKGCLIDLSNCLKQQSFTISLGPLLKNANNKNNSALLLNNPHNPTGKLFTRDEIYSFLDQFVLVVIDEAFMDFLPLSQEQSLIPLIKDYPNLIILRSLTKFYSIPGLRLGYAITHPDRIDKWQKWRDPWSVNILADYVAQAITKDEKWREKTLNWLSPTRQKLYEGLAQIEGLFPIIGCANFLLVKTNFSSSKLQKDLLKNHHILIRDCLSFPELNDSYFRIAVRKEDENNKLLKALQLLIYN